MSTAYYLGALPHRSDEAIIKLGTLERFSDGTRIECRVAVFAEESGGYSVFAMQLPGVISEGETEAEAVANIADAFKQAVLQYRHDNQPIPWGEVLFDRPIPKELWIPVDV